MTATIPNPKFRNEYAINDLQEQINNLGDFGGDLAALTQRVTVVEGVASDALSQAQGAYSVGSAAREAANSAQRTANDAKAKTDKLSVANVSSVGFMNVNGTNNTPGIRIELPGYNRFLYWSDDSLRLWNTNSNSQQWGVRMDLMKYSSFTVKSDIRMLYLYGTLLINFSGCSVTFDNAGNWIYVASLAELRIGSFIGLTPVYSACNRGYEDGYDVTMRLSSDGLYARAGSGKGGTYYVYGQLIAFAWALSGASPLSLEDDGEPMPLEDEDGFMVSDDSLEFVVIGG